MDNKNSVIRQTLGAVCLFVGLFPGIPLLILGLELMVFTVIFTVTGYDATGLGIIFGALFGGAGFALTRALIPGMRWLGLKPRQLAVPMILVSVVSLFFISARMVPGMLSWKNQIDAERQQSAKINDQFRLQDEKILKEFESREIVSVRFSFDFADDYETERKSKSNRSDAQTREAIYVQFVRDRIVDSMEPGEMQNFRMDTNALFYAAEVTRAGYEKLRNNKYARWITLKEKGNKVTVKQGDSCHQTTDYRLSRLSPDSDYPRLSPPITI